jgi:phage gp29-like protein
MVNPVLYGADGQPINRKALLEEEAGTTLSGIRSVLSDYSSSGLTPQKLATLLKESIDGDPERYLALAEEMEEKDLHYLAVIGTRKRAVSQLDITVEPAGDDKNDIANAELLEEFIRRENLEDELFDILDAVGKGFSATEIIWDYSEKQWMPKELKWCDPRWFDFDRETRQKLMLKTDSGLMPLSPYKFINCSIKAKSGLPIRGGLARATAWAYLFKNFDLKGWITFAEVYGQPIRLGKYHPSATETDKRTLLRAVANIGSDAAAIIPNNMLIEFIEGKASGGTDIYEKMADYFDRQVSKAVLGQTTTTDAISGGHAVSKEHQEVRGDIERSDAKQLGAVLKRDLVVPLITLNRGPQDRYPSIKIGRADKTDLTAIQRVLAVTLPHGLKVSQKDVRSKIGLKEPDGEDDILGISKVSSDPLPEEEMATAMQSSKPPSPIDPDEIDLMVRELLEDTSEVLEPLIKPVIEVTESSNSYEELKEKLSSAIMKMDTSKLQEVLEKSNFSARIAGRSGYVKE